MSKLHANGRTFIALLITFLAPVIAVGQEMVWPVDGPQELMTTYGEFQNYANDPYYLHDGLDICAPDGPGLKYVKSISKGMIAYVRWEDRALSKRRFETGLKPVLGPGHEWVILEDVGSNEQPLGVGWAYGHVRRAMMNKLSRRRSPIGW